jgi:hypothetical protein
MEFPARKNEFFLRYFQKVQEIPGLGHWLGLGNFELTEN